MEAVSVLFVLLILAACLCIYFAPSVIARKRNHPDLTSIFVLNLLLGWLLIPWVLALVWAYKNTVPPTVTIEDKKSNYENTQPTSGSSTKYKKCPFCAEEILYAALKCKHCQSTLPAQEENLVETKEPEPTEEELMRQHSISIEDGKYKYGEYSYEKLEHAIGYAKMMAARK